MEKTVERVGKRKGVIIVTGARQVGKSTMLRRRFEKHKYVTLDNPVTYEQATESPSEFIARLDGVIIDEIQRSPKLFEYIKENIDEIIFQRLIGNIPNDGVKFILTGSESFSLMQNVTESLAGRAGIISMSGLSKREINGMDFYKPFMPTKEQLNEKRKFKIKHDYKEIVRCIQVGSYPEMNQGEVTEDAWQEFYGSYLKTYIEKDVRKLVNLQDEASFVKFMRAVAARTGQQLNLSAIAEVIGKDVTTIKRWLSILQTSGLVYLLEPYYNNANKRMQKTAKMYMMDTGLVCYLGGWNTPEQLVNGAMWGHVFETYVVTEIIKSYYNAGIGLLHLYYYRDKEKNEIDLIIEEAGTLYPIEIKTTSDPKRSMIATFDVLKKIPDKLVGEGAIICMCKEILPMGDGNWILSVDMI